MLTSGRLRRASRQRGAARRCCASSSSSASACWPSASGCCRSSSTRSTGEMADNNHLRTIPLRAPRGVAVRPQRPGPRREPRSRSRSRSCASSVTNLDETIRRLAEVDRRRRAAHPRRRAAAPPRAAVPADAGHRARDVRAGGRRHARQLETAGGRTCSRCRRARIRPAAWRRTCSATSARSRSAARRGRVRRRSQPGAIVGQAGLERVYNAQPDGHRRQPLRRRQQRRPRDRRARRSRTPIDGERLQLTIDYDLQRALEDGFRDSGLRRRRPRSSTRAPANPRDDQPAGLRPERVRRRHRQHDLGGSCIRDPLKPMNNRLIQGTYSPGSTFKIVDGDRGARGRRHHAGDEVLLSRARDVLRPHRSSAGRRAATARSTCGTRSSSRATCTSTTSATGSSIDTHPQVRRRCSAWSGKTGIDLPGESRQPRAVDRVEAARRSRRSGTRARRSRSRSARAPCR